MISDSERVTEFVWHPFRVRILRRRFPGVCASLRPPATLLQPFGLRKAGLKSARRYALKYVGQYLIDMGPSFLRQRPPTLVIAVVLSCATLLGYKFST